MLFKVSKHYCQLLSNSQLAFAQIPIIDDVWASRIATGAQLVLPIATLILLVLLFSGMRLEVVAELDSPVVALISTISD